MRYLTALTLTFACFSFLHKWFFSHFVYLTCICKELTLALFVCAFQCCLLFPSCWFPHSHFAFQLLKLLERRIWLTNVQTSFPVWLFKAIAVVFYHLTFSNISILHIISSPLITAKYFLFSIKILLIIASCISFLPSRGPFPSAYRTHSKISVHEGLLKPNPVFA